MGRKRTPADDLFDELYAELEGKVEVPQWVKKAIGARMRERKITLVSAVCPDYAREDERFTYKDVGDGVPYIAGRHLEVVGPLVRALKARNIDVTYYITLADTEFDLPLVVSQMADGDPLEFLARCQRSCEALTAQYREAGLPLEWCRRFTAAFPDWFEHYGRALQIVKREVVEDSSRRIDLDTNAYGRMPLYVAMARGKVDIEYAREMVMRQWAQYMAWAECAESVFGPGFVMLNHTTPNLTMINHQEFRNGRPRVPVLRLEISTMPGT